MRFKAVIFTIFATFFVPWAAARGIPAASPISKAKTTVKRATSWSFPGVDIFAQANQAASTPGIAGQVMIPPGTYNFVTTTLRCKDRVVFFAYGVTVNWTGNKGAAIRCKGVTLSGIRGLKLTGRGLPETSGLQVGSSHNDPSGQTLYNSFEDIQVGNLGERHSGFGVGIHLDGASGGRGTYTNIFKNVVSMQNATSGWHLKPTSANHSNANTFIGCSAEGNIGDGWTIEGANGNWFLGARSETNGGHGFNLTGAVITYGNVWIGGWSESNKRGDFNFGSADKVVETQVVGMVVGSASPGNLTGSPHGSKNVFQFSFSGGRLIDWYGGPIVYHISEALRSRIGFAIANDENPPSRIEHVFAVARSDANVGRLYLGSPEFPVTVRSSLSSSGNFAVTSISELGKAIVNNNSSTSYVIPPNTSYVAFTGTNTKSLDFIFPEASPSIDGLKIDIYTESPVSAQSTWISRGATFVGAPQSLERGRVTRFIYHHATAQWLPN